MSASPKPWTHGTITSLCWHTSNGLTPFLFCFCFCCLCSRFISAVVLLHPHANCPADWGRHRPLPSARPSAARSSRPPPRTCLLPVLGAAIYELHGLLSQVSSLCTVYLHMMISLLQYLVQGLLSPQSQMCATVRPFFKSFFGWNVDGERLWSTFVDAVESNETPLSAYLQRIDVNIRGGHMLPPS